MCCLLLIDIRMWREFDNRSDKKCLWKTFLTLPEKYLISSLLNNVHREQIGPKRAKTHKKKYLKLYSMQHLRCILFEGISYVRNWLNMFIFPTLTTRMSFSFLILFTYHISIYQYLEFLFQLCFISIWVLKFLSKLSL